MLLPLVEMGGQGGAALLLHGFGSDRSSWVGNAAALFPQARVLAVDLPGHGEAAIPDDVGDILSFANAIMASLSHHQIDKLHLIGHSLGGAVAIELAAQRPSLVSTLTLLSPAGLGVGINRVFLAEFAQLSTPEAVLDLLRTMVVNTRLISPMVAPVILAQLARPGIRKYLCRIAVHLTEVERSLQPSINAVVNSEIHRQVIWGDADTINPPDAGRLAAFGGDMHWLENCGHLPHMEKRSEVNRLLSCLLDGFPITNEI